MKNLSLIAAIWVIAGSISSPDRAAAAGLGTRDEAIALVHKVEERLKTDGKENTLRAITAKEFNDRDLYPFINEIDGVLLANGYSAAMIGKNLSAIKDPTGKSPGQAMNEVAKSGTPGWVDYSWPNPTTKKIEAKSVYVEPVAGTNFFIAVGVYN
jgi:signal transduction histidine kinase